MATVEQPGRKEEMNLEDPKNFVQYEVMVDPSIRTPEEGVLIKELMCVISSSLE